MRLGRLAFNAVAFPVIMELTRGQPMVRLFQGMHNAPGSGGGAMLHSNREGQRSSTVGSPSMAKYIVGRDGTIFCQDFVVFVYLDDVNAGDGGVCMVPASHKVRDTPLSPWSPCSLRSAQRHDPRWVPGSVRAAARAVRQLGHRQRRRRGNRQRRPDWRQSRTGAHCQPHPARRRCETLSNLMRSVAIR